MNAITTLAARLFLVACVIVFAPAIVSVPVWIAMLLLAIAHLFSPVSGAVRLVP